jgi:hypothetical protein
MESKSVMTLPMVGINPVAEQIEMWWDGVSQGLILTLRSMYDKLIVLAAIGAGVLTVTRVFQLVRAGINVGPDGLNDHHNRLSPPQLPILPIGEDEIDPRP